MISCFLSNVSAKYYKNPPMLSGVIAKNVGMFFLRHSVEMLCKSIDFFIKYDYLQCLCLYFVMS